MTERPALEYEPQPGVEYVPARMESVIEMSRVYQRPEWDEYFLLLAYSVALRGSCKRKRVGAVIVDQSHRIVSTGYNGAPRGQRDCLEAGCDVREIDGRKSCVRTLHAESNAIDFARESLIGCWLYTTIAPCRNCALRIVQAGIKRVVYDEWYESQGSKEVVHIFENAKPRPLDIEHVQLQGPLAQALRRAVA
jgi:dCMP deaminase